MPHPFIPCTQLKVLPPHAMTVTEFLPSFYYPPHHSSIAVPRDLGETPPPSFQRMLKWHLPSFGDILKGITAFAPWDHSLLFSVFPQLTYTPLHMHPVWINRAFFGKCVSYLGLLCPYERCPVCCANLKQVCDVLVLQVHKIIHTYVGCCLRFWQIGRGQKGQCLLEANPMFVYSKLVNHMQQTLSCPSFVHKCMAVCISILQSQHIPAEPSRVSASMQCSLQNAHWCCVYNNSLK